MSEPKRGEVWWGEIEDVGRGPFLVMSRPSAIPVVHNVLAAPVTRTIRDLPTEVRLGPEDGMPAECAASFDNLRVVEASVWNERDTDEVFTQYVDSVIELAHSGTVDVLAHLDVIKVAGHRAPRIREHEDRLINGISPADVVIELSSAGLRKPVADTYPSALLLDRVLDAGFELTTASDAHSIEHIGWGFERLTAELDQRAVRTLTSFHRRQRQLHPR